MTLIDDYHQRALKRFKEERRDPLEQVQKKTRTFSIKELIKETKYRYQYRRHMEQTEYLQQDMELKLQHLQEVEEKSQQHPQKSPDQTKEALF